MNLQPVGIRAIALNFPRTIRTNDYYRENYPQMVAEAEQKLWLDCLSQIILQQIAALISGRRK